MQDVLFSSVTVAGALLHFDSVPAVGTVVLAVAADAVAVVAVNYMIVEAAAWA